MCVCIHTWQLVGRGGILKGEYRWSKVYKEVSACVSLPASSTLV